MGEWASGHTACTYKDHAKNIIEGLRGTKLSILSAYSVQKYFHTLVLLLILQKLIGIFIVKTLFRRAPLLMVMKVEKSALLGKPSICFILKKKILNMSLSIRLCIQSPKEQEVRKLMAYLVNGQLRDLLSTPPGGGSYSPTRLESAPRVV